MCIFCYNLYLTILRITQIYGKMEHNTCSEDFKRIEVILVTVEWLENGSLSFVVVVVVVVLVLVLVVVKTS